MDPKQPPYAKALRAALLEGKSIADAARVAGCSPRTAFYWLSQNRDALAVDVLRSSGIGRFLLPLRAGRPRLMNTGRSAPATGGTKR